LVEKIKLFFDIGMDLQDPMEELCLQMVKEFNRNYPEYQVIMQKMDWATYYNKLFVAGIGKRSPDIFVVHTDSLLRFKKANLL